MGCIRNDFNGRIKDSLHQQPTQERWALSLMEIPGGKAAYRAFYFWRNRYRVIATVAVICHRLHQYTSPAVNGGSGGWNLWVEPVPSVAQAYSRRLRVSAQAASRLSASFFSRLRLRDLSRPIGTALRRLPRTHVRGFEIGHVVQAARINRKPICIRADDGCWPVQRTHRFHGTSQSSQELRSCYAQIVSATPSASA